MTKEWIISLICIIWAVFMTVQVKQMHDFMEFHKSDQILELSLPYQDQQVNYQFLQLIPSKYTEGGYVMEFVSSEQMKQVKKQFAEDYKAYYKTVHKSSLFGMLSKLSKYEGFQGFADEIVNWEKTAERYSNAD